MNIIKKTELFVKAHKATILSIAGVGGVFLTAFLSSKAALKADKVLKYEEEKKGSPLTTGEKIAYSAFSYIPTAVAAAGTSAAIIASDRIHLKAEAALAAVVTGLSEKRDFLVEQTAKLSARAETYISHGVEVLPGEVLFHDQYLEEMGDSHGGYFAMSMVDFKDSVIDGNREMQSEYALMLNYFYDRWGVEWQPDAERYGWSAERIFEEHLDKQGWPDGVCFLEIYAMPVMNGDAVDYYEVIYEIDPRLDNNPDLPW